MLEIEEALGGGQGAQSMWFDHSTSPAPEGEEEDDSCSPQAK